MATIQIRDIPDDTYELIRSQAQDAGQSIQAFMREQLIELSGARAAKAAAIRQLTGYLADEGPVGLTAEQIVADLHAERR